MKLMTQLLGAAAALSFTVAAWAAGVPYDKAKFDQAVAAGEPVVVQFHASWCPTCKAQEPIVSELLQEPKLKGLQFYAADFDTETALKKALKVSMQSTFVVFKGGKEVARSTGQTQRAAIEETFAKAF